MQKDAPTPWSLHAAAALTGLEGLGAVVGGAWMAVAVAVEQPRGLAIALSSAVFVLAAGALLFVLAVGLLRRRRWSRGPTVFVQLLMLPLGWQLLERPTTAIGVAMLVLAVVTLVLVLLPPSTAVFRAEHEQRTF